MHRTHHRLVRSILFKFYANSMRDFLRLIPLCIWSAGRQAVTQRGQASGVNLVICWLMINNTAIIGTPWGQVIHTVVTGWWGCTPWFQTPPPTVPLATAMLLHRLSIGNLSQKSPLPSAVMPRAPILPKALPIAAVPHRAAFLLKRNLFPCKAVVCSTGGENVACNGLLGRKEPDGFQINL